VLDLAPNGSLAKAAADRLKMAQDAAAQGKTGGVTGGKTGGNSGGAPKKK
jgi:hypothetical protein